LYLAALDGNPERERMRDGILASLSKTQRAAAQQRVSVLLRHYGPDAIHDRLLPVLVPDEQSRLHIQAVSREPPKYPREARREGLIGAAMVEYSIAPTGHARDYAVVWTTDPRFGEAALDAARTWRYEPVRLGGAPAEIVGRRARVDFELEDQGFDADRVRADIEAIGDQARAGDPVAMYRYADAIRAFTSMGYESREATRWFAASAQQGVPEAQYQLGLSLLRGEGCEPDTAKGLDWLGRAAAMESARAQLVLGTELLRRTPSKADVETAMAWLNSAADLGYTTAMLKLAWILATHPDPALRDGDRALTLATTASETHADKITVHETLAAAHAERHSFAHAQRDQRLAIRLGNRIDLPMDTMKARLASYRADEPWRAGPY
jgi:TonB family protein